MIGITIGDPSGIGPEITLKALSRIKNPAKIIRLIGSRLLLDTLNKQLKTNIKLTDMIYDINTHLSFKYGRPQKKCGVASFLQLHLATYLLKIGKINGIVTAPVSKAALSMAGFPFPGQTEYFAREFGVKKYGMLAWSNTIKVILVTIHKPLKDVPKLISEENVLEKIELLNNYFVYYEKKRKPKIGVLALNPHAFEFSCGKEKEICKAINKAKNIGIKAEGPIPGDTLHMHTGFDGFVAMYHDQGMIPVKLLSQGAGVNMTLGLPFVRTAPLHGTAFDIAGKGTANPDAMHNAIRLCQRLT
jgi:4-hydroxythreonine-4-phosphate dehydrogenase